MTAPPARSSLHPAHWAFVCLVLAAAAMPARADDRGILRTAGQTPYVFVIFDSSGSMATLPNGAPAPANGDDPQSKFYAAKKVAYEVFSTAVDVNFGFASFNQDNLHVIGKHWIYTAATGTSAALTAAKFPVSWPSDGEQWVFGTNFPTSATGPSGMPAIAAPGTLGSCAAGASLSSFMSQLDRFPKLQANQDDKTNPSITQSDSNQSTVMYITVGGKTYKYTVSRDPNTPAGNPNLGASTAVQPMSVEVTVDPCPGVGGGRLTATLTFNLGTPAAGGAAGAPGPFLMNESAGATNPSGAAVDDQNGYWNYSDVLQFWTCSGQPFSGLGQEGNYDGTYTNPPLASSGTQARMSDTCIDAAGNFVYCDPYGSYLSSPPAGCSPFQSDGAGSASCLQNLKHPTTIAPPIPGFDHTTAALDSGDLLPWNWNASNRTDFLSRFSPSLTTAALAYTQADYFSDFPDATGFLPLKDPGLIPLLAAGPTPLGASIVDFRCWLIGDQKGGTKCKNAGNYSSFPWQPLANTESATWGCAKPFLILITDGNDTCKGPDPTADVANLKTKSSPPVTTWVIDIGADCSKPGNPIKSITSGGVGGGGGTLVCPDDTRSLRDALQKILGQIKESSLEFATAAVPEVQASTSDKVYLSDFNPTGGSGAPGTLTGPSSSWEGHVNAFLKPLLLTPSGVPDTTTRVCTSLAPTDQVRCFLWDAKEQMVNQVPPSPGPYLADLGDDDAHRRLFYSILSPQGSWAAPLSCLSGTSPCRQLLNPILDTAPASAPLRYDLWNAFQVPYHRDNPGVDATAQSAVNSAINATESLKMHTFASPTVHTDTYILGDIFHSNPLIVGTPPNVKYFALNLNVNGTATCDPDGSKNTQTGYQCFATRHSNRRKLLLVGSNDGMLHAFDIGQPHVTPNGVTFDNGSGREVWAYMPRAVMATVNAIATGTNQHWTVDGPPQAADVFIDPLQTGTPNPSHRDWRTVVVGGLREGPEDGTGGLNAYYALDITQPDPLGTTSGTPAVPFFPTDIGTAALPDPSQIATLIVPTCDGVKGTPAAGCGTRFGSMPYPAPLWEFYDQAHNADGSTVLDVNGNPVLIDEDVNGTTDLGHTWSTPTIGRIQIAADATGKTTIDKYVAIFGGGLDRNTKTSDSPAAGNWLYMVDVETGKAIYKQKLLGCAPGTAAAVDTTQTGVLNRIYIGTTSGHMYRVDLGPDKNGKLPHLQAGGGDVTSVLGTDGSKHPELRLVDSSGQPAWTPREIFNANFNGSTPTTLPRSIYFTPSVIFDAHLGLYALAFGTGDREDLWSTDTSGQLERYYVFLDDTDLLSTPTVLNESDLTPITLGSSPGANVLENGTVGHRGWFLTLGHFAEPNADGSQTIFFAERVTTNTFALSGVNVFSTFTPEVNFGSTAGGKSGSASTCTDSGLGSIIATFTQNGGTILTDPVTTLVTDVGPEVGQTKNFSPSSSGGGGGTGTGAGSGLTPDLISVMNTLKQLFPRNCKFGNFRIDIKAHATNTGVIFVAPVPVCIIEKNWKEY